MTDKKLEALAADHPEHHLEMVGRWYMVNRDGMATLCADREDAENEAADAQRFWPHMGPHRAVRLVEASFEAADMATAAADGFRASAAEVAKLKGQRMVLCSLLGECLPVIDALMQIPGDDDSDARLNGLMARVGDALDAARYRWRRERSSTMFVNISINGEGAEIAATLDSAVDAARKQGGAT